MDSDFWEALVCYVISILMVIGTVILVVGIVAGSCAFGSELSVEQVEERIAYTEQQMRVLEMDLRSLQRLRDQLQPKYATVEFNIRSEKRKIVPAYYQYSIGLYEVTSVDSVTEPHEFKRVGYTSAFSINNIKPGKYLIVFQMIDDYNPVIRFEWVELSAGKNKVNIFVPLAKEKF